MATQRQIERVEDELGWEVDERWLDRVLNEYADYSLGDIRRELENLEAEFEERGGRGVRLADEIDRLRAVIAARGR